MTCYIINRKANDFSRTSDFAVTIAVVAYGSLCVCILSASAFSMPYLLRLHLLCFNELSACQLLLWLAPSTSAVSW